MKFLKDYDSDHCFSEDEIKELVCNQTYYDEPIKIVDIDYSETLDRWTRNVTTTFKVGDRYFRVNWAQGLTECQENSYWDKIDEVVPHTEIRMIQATTTTTWEVVRKAI